MIDLAPALLGVAAVIASFALVLAACAPVLRASVPMIKQLQAGQRQRWAQGVYEREAPTFQEARGRPDSPSPESQSVSSPP